jgi:copper homeostasis protein
MKHDIEVCRQLKVDGIVLGILNSDGSVDKNRTIELATLAGPMPVTFHRAFDITSDSLKAMEDIISCGCRRILTSGQKPTAVEGAELIAELIHVAKDRIIIMPGGGVRPSNIMSLIEKTNAAEIHSSERKIASALKLNSNKLLK